jgi:FkbM family methyltransferase
MTAQSGALLGNLSTGLNRLVSFFYRPGRYYRIVSGPLAGQKIFYHRQLNRSVLNGSNEIRNLQAISKLIQHQVGLKKTSDIIDAGAGVGVYELFFNKMLGNTCNIYAFEPNENGAKEWRKNMQANNIGNADLVTKALSSKIGLIDFYETSLQGSSLNEKTVQGREYERKSVYTTTLDIFCKRYHIEPAFIRLNTEGGTHLSLAGCHETIRRFRPMMLINTKNLEESQSVNEVLEQFGYEAFDIAEFQWVKQQLPEDETEDRGLTGSLLLCPRELKEEVSYALFNKYRRDAEAASRLQGASRGKYAFN